MVALIFGFLSALCFGLKFANVVIGQLDLTAGGFMFAAIAVLILPYV
jgi:hypothetical protein